MPWTVKDVDEHKKGLTPSQKKKWVKVANGVLKDCLADGGSQKKCEGKAIRIANSKFEMEIKMERVTEKVPKGAFRLMDHQLIQFSQKDGEKAKMDMMIYTGGIIKDHWWWGDLAIDLGGMKFPKSKYPILENHNTFRKIAFTKKPIVDKDIRVDPNGVEFVETDESEEFQKLSKQGFPYEASMYAVPTNIERLESGATAKVNGMTIKGPASIWRKAIFKEASVCVFGWDTNTKASAFGDNEELEITLEVQKTESDLGANGTEKNKGKEVKLMDLSELKDQHPDLVEAIKGEVTSELTVKFDKDKTELEAKVTDLEGKLQKKDETINSQEDRILKLEKSEVIREESDRKTHADRIWDTKLEASDIPDHLYEKVRAQVSYTKFVNEKGELDTEAFSKALDTEIQDWEGRGVTKTVIGGGFTKKTVTDDDPEAQLAKDDDEAVEEMAKLAGEVVSKEG